MNDKKLKPSDLARYQDLAGYQSLPPLRCGQVGNPYNPYSALREQRSIFGGLF